MNTYEIMNTKKFILLLFCIFCMTLPLEAEFIPPIIDISGYTKEPNDGKEYEYLLAPGVISFNYRITSAGTTGFDRIVIDGKLYDSNSKGSWFSYTLDFSKFQDDQIHYINLIDPHSTWGSRFSFKVMNEDEAIDGVYYVINDKNASVGTISNDLSEVTLSEFYVKDGITYPVTTINPYAFYGRSNLSDIEIPASIEKIGICAFGNCSDLRFLTFKDSDNPIELGYDTFNIEGAGIGLFAQCPLVYIYLGRTYSVSDYNTTFPYHKYPKLYGFSPFPTTITEIYIAQHIKFIPEYFIYNLYRIKSITIPSSVETIGENAFYGNQNLTSVFIKDLERWCNISFANKYSNPLVNKGNLIINGETLTDLSLPSSLKEIKNYSFYGCEGLINIVIPASVSHIGDGAFSSINSISKILSLAETPPVLSAVEFPFSNYKAELKVPYKALKDYMNSDWNLFKYLTAFDLPSEIPPSGISISPQSNIELKIGDTLQFNVTIEPENASDKTVIWESSNPDVATVDDKGLVTAYSSGSVIITAKDAMGHTASAQVTVYARATGISIEPSTPQEIYIGNVLWLKAIVTPEDASDRNVTWESSNPYVAEVDKNGKVIAYKGGKAIITAHCENVKAEIIIRVKIILNEDKVELKVGETFQLNVLSSDTSSESVVWKSSDPEIADVDQNGLITALEEGKATITASLSDLSASCEVTVFKDDKNDDNDINDNNNIIVWDQDFRCSLGDIISLQVSNPYGKYITCKSLRPDGGYEEAQVYEENGIWYAYCHSEGTVMIEAWLNDFPDKKISKTFNVLRDPEELIYYNGLYFRFIDEFKKALKVCRGFAPYEGDYTIPGNEMGYDVLEIEDMAFYTCKNLGKIMIEDGVKKIGDQSFGNGSIYEIHIPSTVTVIKDWAFNANNPGFKDIYLYGLNPVDVNEEIFNGYVDYEKCVLHIPYGTIDKYRNATVWSDFLNIVEDIPVIKTETIKIVPNSIALEKGEEYQLQVIIEPKNTMERSIEWKDYNPEIISVSENGLVRGLKKGKTTLMAVCGLASAKCDIEVSSDYNDNDSVSFILEDENDSFTVINLQGIVLMKNVSAEKLNLLEAGSYIIISEISGKRSKVLISN